MIISIKLFVITFICSLIIQTLIAKNAVKFNLINATTFACIVVILNLIVKNLREKIENMETTEEEVPVVPVVSTIAAVPSVPFLPTEAVPEINPETVYKPIQVKIQEPVIDNEVMELPEPKINDNEISEVIVKLKNGNTSISRPIQVDNVNKIGSNKIRQLGETNSNDYVLMDPKYWLDETPVRGICSTGGCLVQSIELSGTSQYLRVD
jgi:hypothetical protein